MEAIPGIWKCDVCGAHGLDELRMEVYPHAHWVKGLFRDLREAGCAITSYVSVLLSSCRLLLRGLRAERAGTEEDCGEGTIPKI
eukprot:793924-Pelagomonas_calceolata.AAC.2